jgi:gliding motility-associated-like protein
MKKSISILVLYFGLCSNGFTQNKSEYFVENKGQIITQRNQPNSDVLFLFSSKGMNVQLKKNGFSYDLFDLNNKTSNIRTNRIDIEFENPSDKLTIIKNYKADFQTNVVGANKHSFQNINHYKQITYKNVYPGIDFVFKINIETSQFKYDILLHPGSNIENIQLKYEGFDHLDIVENELVIKNSIRAIKEQIPLSFNTTNNKPIKVDFRISHVNKEQAIVRFFTSDLLNKNDGYVIDPFPSLVWGKYIGDSLYTETKGVITDRFGNSYICGSTQSFNNIATAGAYQDTIADSLINDAFVSKYFKYGGILWSTYFGGEAEDIANSIYVDTNFNVFIAGTTFSQTGITDSTGFQDTLSGNGDAFLAKFNSAGGLLWSTYFGGDSLDYAKKLSTDYYGNIYMTGDTRSFTGIASGSGAQQFLQGEQDGFIVKFDTAGVLVWSSYIGGNGLDYANGVAYGDTSIYIVGSTNSTDLTSTSGSVYQQNYNDNFDGFISKLNNQGQIIWQSYFGGDKMDEINGVKVLNNNIFIVGTTLSDSNIVDLSNTIIINQSTKNDTLDAFYGKLNRDGQLQWSSYWGGNDVDLGIDLFFELDSNLFVVGTSFSDSLIGIDTSSYQIQNNGNGDVIISKIYKTGDLMWTSFYGGLGAEQTEGIAVYGNTSIYVVGSTLSDSAITSLQDTIYPNIFNSQREGFFSKFIQSFSTIPAGVSGSNCDTCVVCDTCTYTPQNWTPNYRCPGQEIMLTLNGGDLGTDAEWVWYKGQCGNSAVIGTGDTIYVYPTQSTTYFVRAESITNASECISTSVLIAPYPNYSINTNAYMCSDDSLILDLSGFNSSTWTGEWHGVNNFDSSTLYVNVGSSHPSLTGWYFVNFFDNYSCYYSDSINIQYANSPMFSIETTDVACFEGIDGEIQLIGNDLDSCSVYWSNGVVDSLVNSGLSAGWYSFDVTNQYNCKKVDSIEIVQPLSFLHDTIIQPTDCLDSTGVVILYLDTLLSPYNITWNNINQSSDTISNMPYGANNITVTSSNNCVESYIFHIGNVNLLEAHIDSVKFIGCPTNNNSEIHSQGLNGNPPYIYAWQPTNSSDSILYGVEEGWHYLTITDQSGCYAIDSAEMLTDFSLTIHLYGEASSCLYPSGQVVATINDTNLIDHFYWSNGDSTNLFLNNIWPNSYFFTVIDTMGCVYLDSIEISTYNDIDLFFNPDIVSITEGDSVQLLPIFNGDNSFAITWSPQTELSCANCLNPFASPMSSVNYTILVSNDYCTDSSTITIEVGKNCIDVFIPTIFSPNNDQLNDTWEIFGSCISKMDLNVFNQWGNQIFETTSQNFPWDGTYQGSLVPIGQYSYQLFVEFLNGTTEMFSGFVQVTY